MSKGKKVSRSARGSAYRLPRNELVRVAGAGPGRTWAIRVGVAGAATTFWAVYIGMVAIADGGLGVKAEVWGGLIAWAGLSVLALATIATPSGDANVTSSHSAGLGRPCV